MIFFHAGWGNKVKKIFLEIFKMETSIGVGSKIKQDAFCLVGLFRVNSYLYYSTF
jgi:hypothetical protein